MTLFEKMDSGMLYTDAGDGPEEAELERIRQRGKELVYDYNQTRPAEMQRRDELLRQICAEVGKQPFVETPVHFSYGSRTHIGDYFYANFNLVIVDDIDVYIGDSVMFAPNVTISATGHPVHPDLRADGSQFSLPVHIGSHVWIGAEVVILPGVTIGDNSVIGAGSIVTKDVPSDVVAFGNPCRVQREITERDRLYYYKDRRVE